MRILSGCLKCLQFAIVIACLILIGYIAYFNVVEYRRVLMGFGLPELAAFWVGFASFWMIQAQEIRPILLKSLHNKSAEMIAFAERQPDKDAKLLALQLKEEHAIRPRRIRRATWLALIFTGVDLIICTFFLFTPLIKPGVNLLTVLLTMNPALINWVDVLKTLGTVWLLPLLVKMLITESDDTGLPNLSGAFEALKARLKERFINKPSDKSISQPSKQSEQPKSGAPQPLPGFPVVPYTVPVIPQENTSNGKATHPSGSV